MAKKKYMTKEQYARYNKRYKITMRVLISTASVLAAITAGVAGYGLSGILKTDAKYNNDYSNLMIQTLDGNTLYLPIDKEEPIAVVIDGFNNNEKKSVVKAINDLDNISETINYVILDQDSDQYKQKIYIDNNAIDLNNDYFKSANGVTFLGYNNDGMLYYPLQIKLRENLVNQVNFSGDTLLSYVVRHEMMHTLGFKDLYEESQADETVMYYNSSYWMFNPNYTKRDKDAIRKMYDEAVEVEAPETAYYVGNGDYELAYNNFVEYQNMMSTNNKAAEKLNYSSVYIYHKSAEENDDKDKMDENNGRSFE